MAIPYLSQDQLLAARTQIEQALHNHEQWCEELYATLVCHLPPDERDTQNEPHRKCRFGQWYYAQGASTLAQQPGFVEVEVEHKRMHEFAAALLNTSALGNVVPLPEYERFVAAMKRMRLEMLTLRRELESSLSNLDPLTGLANRFGMLTWLREQHALAQRGVQSCCVAMLDFDHFKRVNDQYGHQIGDAVLVRTAQCALQQVRPYDKLFRFGGEEFLLCMPNTEELAAKEICNRVREHVAAIRHLQGSETPLSVTVSIGLARLDPSVTVEESLEIADRALYTAKDNGRNRIVIWDAALIGREATVLAH